MAKENALSLVNALSISITLSLTSCLRLYPGVRVHACSLKFQELAYIMLALIIIYPAVKNSVSENDRLRNRCALNAKRYAWSVIVNHRAVIFQRGYPPFCPHSTTIAGHSFPPVINTGTPSATITTDYHYHRNEFELSVLVLLLTAAYEGVVCVHSRVCLYFIISTFSTTCVELWSMCTQGRLLKI